MLQINNNQINLSYFIETDNEQKNIIFDVNFFGVKKIGILENLLNKFPSIKRGVKYSIKEDGTLFFLNKKNKNVNLNVKVQDVLSFLEIEY